MQYQIQFVFVEIQNKIFQDYLLNSVDLGLFKLKNNNKTLMESDNWLSSYLLGLVSLILPVTTTGSAGFQ